MSLAGDPTKRTSPGEGIATPPDTRLVWMLRTLRAAVARACPGDLAAQREDLVQVALVRVLERERADEQNTVRTASYLWRVAFSVTADELRRRRSEAGRAQGTDMRPDGVQEASTPGPELGLGIRECLSRLPEPRRMAVLLHLQGFRAEEATRVLHWNLKRVQNLTYRGLADLRQCLSSKGLAR
jgi:RNA polymerase sigma-70 factor, ECF subfamily